MSVMRPGSSLLMSVAVLLVFGVTLALTWPRGAQEPRTQAATAQAPAAARGPTHTPPAVSAPASEPTPAAAAVAVVRGQPLANEAPPAPEAAAPSLPVHLIFQARRLAADPRDPTHQGRSMVVRLVNSSHEALPVEVLVTSAEQNVKLQLQIVLQPHQSQELGADAGAALESGDVITVKSPNYRDLVRPI